MRTIHLKRGLRALGYLPRRRSREKVAPAGHVRGTDSSLAPATPLAEIEKLASLESRREAIAESDTRTRQWAPNGCETVQAKLVPGTPDASFS